MSGNLTGSANDFKSKVQKKILEMSQDLKNPSPISSNHFAATNGNLDGYLKNQACFNMQSSHSKGNRNSADSMQNNIDG